MRQALTICYFLNFSLGTLQNQFNFIFSIFSDFNTRKIVKLIHVIIFIEKN